MLFRHKDQVFGYIILPKSLITVFLLLVLLLAGNSLASSQTESNPLALKHLSLEDLVNLEVVSASKKVEKLTETDAAIFVITGDQLRRSGFTSLPEALRMVPGLQVAKIDANEWAITSRGFVGTFANKLLVLIDGRSVYTPLFSGVYWDIQNLLLEDVDRIEVIRGPGATLWGANAVNGVINIITKNAKDTQGGLLHTEGGSANYGLASFRFGHTIGGNYFWRLCGKFDRWDNTEFNDEVDYPGNRKMYNFGFRIDSDEESRDKYLLEGRVYAGETMEMYNVPQLSIPYNNAVFSKTNSSGGHILGRWTRTYSTSTELSLQAYFDRTTREDVLIIEDRNTIDVDFQHRFPLLRNIEFMWGCGIRRTMDSIDSTSVAWGIPNSKDDDLFSSFFQLEIPFADDKLKLTVGSKFENNSYTGNEFQPGMRIRWFPGDRQTIWAAITRAVRSPSRVEHDARIRIQALPPGTPDNPGTIPAMLVLTGDTGFESEEMLAYEVGYKILPKDNFSLDLSAYYNVYHKLRSLVAGQIQIIGLPPSHVVIPMHARNEQDAKTYGIEIAMDLQTSGRMSHKLSYGYFHINLKAEDAGGRGFTDREGGHPRHQVFFTTSLDVPKDIALDVNLRYVDELSALLVENYFTVDARLGWKPVPHLELAVVGQNLVDEHHKEFKSELNGLSSCINRSVYGTISWRF